MRRPLTAALLALPLFAHAWGPDGHQTVATIAAGLIQGTPAELRALAARIVAVATAASGRLDLAAAREDQPA